MRHMWQVVSGTFLFKQKKNMRSTFGRKLLSQRDISGRWVASLAAAGGVPERVAWNPATIFLPRKK